MNQAPSGATWWPSARAEYAAPTALGTNAVPKSFCVGRLGQAACQKQIFLDNENMSAQKTLHAIEAEFASCSRHLLFASLALTCLTFQLHAQNLIYHPPVTAQQQWNGQQAYQQQQRQYEMEKKQQEIQDQIDNLNSEIDSKSNALEKLLLPKGNPWFLSACEKTNVAERLKELGEQKRQLPKDPWREIDGKKVFVRGDAGFTAYAGKVLQTTPHGILIQSYTSINMETVFIKNFPYVYGDGTEIPFFPAHPCEPYSYTTILGASETVNAADYGTPCSPPSNADEIEAAAFRITPEEESKIKKDADTALTEITNAQAELATARKNLKDFFQKFEDEKQAVLKAQEQKKKAVQDNVLKWNQQQADNGDAYGLLRMGERYRDGDGVPKDLAKSREYLAKAAAAGSTDAADELSKLNQASTNSMTAQ